MKVNLHTHSNHSDGKLTPSQLINRLAENNVEVVALTDHDTISGIMEAKKQANNKGIMFINGIEISTKINGLDLGFLDENRHTLHLLGLGYDYNILHYIFSKKNQIKKINIKKLVSDLIYDGYKIDDIDYGSKKTLVAKNLIKHGYVNDIQDAFNNIINKYYPRSLDLINVEQVVDIIHTAKGKVIWAHPYEILNDITKFGINEAQIDLICKKLKLFNVDGIEVYYSNYNSSQIEYLKFLQNKYNFITSSGTDFHGKKEDEAIFIDINSNLIKEVVK